MWGNKSTKSAGKEPQDAQLANAKSVIDSTPAIIITILEDGIIQYINHAVAGYHKDKVIGTSVYSFVPAQFRHMMEEKIASVFKTGEPASYETQGEGPDGEKRWYSTYLSLVKGEAKEVVMLSMDITEQKIRETALEERISELEGK